MSEAAAAEPKVKKSLNLDFIMPLINTVAILGVMGLMVYTRLMYKRPMITEAGERAHLEKIKASPPPPAIVGNVPFESMLINLAPTENQDNHSRPRSHHITVSFNLEIRDQGQSDLIEELKPMILDQMISLLGKKRIADLNHVQGRYLLRSEIMELCNHIVSKYAPNKESLVTNVFFTQYTVQ